MHHWIFFPRTSTSEPTHQLRAQITFCILKLHARQLNVDLLKFTRRGWFMFQCLSSISWSPRRGASCCQLLNLGPPSLVTFLKQAAALWLLTERMTCRKSGSSLSFESTRQIVAVAQTHPTDEVTLATLH
jgi:hypothetical protein